MATAGLGGRKQAQSGNGPPHRLWPELTEMWRDGRGVEGVVYGGVWHVVEGRLDVGGGYCEGDVPGV